MIGAVHYSHPAVQRDYVISVDSDLSYISEITRVIHPSVVADTNGIGCGLLLVIFEFLNDMMESRSFHIKLVRDIDRGEVDFQSDFLEFSEQCLQLLSKAAQCFDTAGDRNVHNYRVVIGKFCKAISLPAIAKNARHWSLSLLQSLQRLLDTPTFVTILQVRISNIYVFSFSFFSVFFIYSQLFWYQFIGVTGS